MTQGWVGRPAASTSVRADGATTGTRASAGEPWVALLREHRSTGWTATQVAKSPGHSQRFGDGGDRTRPREALRCGLDVGMSRHPEVLRRQCTSRQIEFRFGGAWSGRSETCTMWPRLRSVGNAGRTRRTSVRRVAVSTSERRDSYLLNAHRPQGGNQREPRALRGLRDALAETRDTATADPLFGVGEQEPQPLGSDQHR